MPSFTQADPQPLPQPQVPLQLPDGSISPAWYLYLKSTDAALRALLAFVRAQNP